MSNHCSPRIAVAMRAVVHHIFYVPNFVINLNLNTWKYLVWVLDDLIKWVITSHAFWSDKNLWFGVTVNSLLSYWLSWAIALKTRFSRETPSYYLQLKKLVIHSPTVRDLETFSRVKFIWNATHNLWRRSHFYLPQNTIACVDVVVPYMLFSLESFP